MVSQPRRTLTYEDYAQFPDDGHRWELIDGEAYMSPAPRTAHQDVLVALVAWVKSHVDAHDGGRVFVAPYDVVLSDTNVLQPDLVFVADDRLEFVTPANVKGVPSWLVEVVSDPVRDKKVKRDTYMAHGVPEYWTVDIDLRAVEVWRPGRPGDVHEPPAALAPGCLPGLAIDLTTLFDAAGPQPTRI